MAKINAGMNGLILIFKYCTGARPSVSFWSTQTRKRVSFSLSRDNRRVDIYETALQARAAKDSTGEN